jgi:hypothetical protein
VMSSWLSLSNRLRTKLKKRGSAEAFKIGRRRSADRKKRWGRGRKWPDLAKEGIDHRAVRKGDVSTLKVH